jgi:Right handed beta helix region
MKNRSRFTPLVFFFTALIAAAPAFAATVAVGTCVPNKASYSTITDAVQGAPAGSTILLCPGVYAEQVVISKSLTLKGQTVGNSAYPVIMPPAGGLLVNAAGLNVNSFFGLGTPLSAQVLIQGSAAVTINDIALDATGYNIPNCDSIVVGILVQDASVTLNRVAVKNQLQTDATCAIGGTGSGVLVQNDNTNPTAVSMQNSTFINASQAFEADGASNTSTLTDNSFTGNPANDYNAINILNGSSSIQQNTISSYNFPPAATPDRASFGIYMTCATGGTVNNNRIGGTQVGIYVFNPGCPTSGISITNNKVWGAQYIGIDVGQANGSVVSNDIRSTQTAIRLPGASAGNTIQSNTVNDACAAFGSSTSAGVNTILNNTISNAQNLAITNTTALCP